MIPETHTDPRTPSILRGRKACSAGWRILIADDQPDILEALRLLLKQEEYEIETVSSPAAVRALLQGGNFDLLLMDLNYARDTTSGREGMSLATEIRRTNPAISIVAMTAWGSIELAVEALHRGVDDFVLKPWDNRRLLTMLAEHLARSAERREAQRSAEEERRSAENWEMQLADARATQSALLPASALRLGGYCVAGASLPFHEIGGDYFDFFRNGDGQIALCIADVMGKGVPAALLMSNLQAAVHGLNRAGLAPAELTSRVNGALCKNPRGGKFVSFFFALLNAASGTLVYTNAGHNAPTLVRANGEMERLSDGGGVLGIFPGAVFEEGEARLGAGDLLALFTDGLTEVCNPAGEELGEARLMKLLRNRRDLPPEQIHLAVLGDSKVFSGGPFRDDATLVVLTAR